MFIVCDFQTSQLYFVIPTKQNKEKNHKWLIFAFISRFRCFIQYKIINKNDFLRKIGGFFECRCVNVIVETLRAQRLYELFKKNNER